MIIRIFVYAAFLIFLLIAFTRITCQTIVFGYSLKEDIFLKVVKDAECKQIIKLEWSED